MARADKDLSVPSKASKSLLYISFSVAILPILLTPPLMDVRWWFIRVPADLNYSVSSIPAYWVSELLPGRFVPISDFWGYTYMYTGHKFLQVTQSPVNYFDFATKLALIVALYFALRSLIRELGPNLHFESVNTFTLILLTVWGLGANVFWLLNGTVAYPSLIYPILIVAILFASQVLKTICVSESGGVHGTRRIAFLVIASTLWANFYYELAYTTIAAIIMAIVVSPIAEFSRVKRIRLAGVFLGGFLAIWIPMRIILARQCSADLSECYDGSELSLSGTPATFLKNVVNAIPLTDYSALDSYQLGSLPLVITWATLLVAGLISFSLIASMRKVMSDEIDASDQVLVMQARLTAILLVVGIFAAAIMSVSSLSQRTVDWGYAYRHAPTLWLGYSALFLMLIVFVLTRININVGTILVVLLVAILTTGQWGRSWSVIREYNKSFEPVSRLYHELYNADTRMAGQGNDRRCLIVKELASKEVNFERYIEPSEKFMKTFHNVPFCRK